MKVAHHNGPGGPANPAPAGFLDLPVIPSPGMEIQVGANKFVVDRRVILPPHLRPDGVLAVVVTSR